MTQKKHTQPHITKPLKIIHAHLSTEKSSRIILHSFSQK